MSEFKLPSGFKETPQTSTPKGKEFWLIQIPPKFDISKLKSLPLASSTFAHGKKQKPFQLTEDDSEGQKTIHLGKPLKDHKGIKLSSKLQISKSFTISRLAHVPEIDYVKAAEPKPLPQQPNGLTVKHFASGFGPNNERGDESAAKKEKKSKKRSHDDEPSPKKHKKHKKEKKDKK